MTLINILSIVNLKSCGIEPHIGPISEVEFIQNIDLLGHRKGSAMPKINYIIPKNNYHYYILVFQLFEGIKLSLKRKYSLIVSYSLFPYGLMALFIGKISKTPTHIGIIGGDIDVHCKSFYKKITIWLIKKFDIITVTGTDHQKFLIDRSIPKTKIFILPNSVDNEKFFKKSVTKEYDIVWAGRFSSEKRPTFFLQIIKELKICFPDIRVVMLGDGKLKEEIKRYIRKNNLMDNIFLPGWVSNVEDYYNKSKIFVLCSSREGLPIAMEEAIFCGLPVISSNVGSIDNIINNSKNGFLIDKNAGSSEYVRKIIMLLSDGELYEEFSRNALEITEYCSKNNASRIWRNIIYEIEGEKYGI